MLKLFTGAHGSVLPVLSLLLFLALFAAVAAYLASDRRRRHHLDMARLPLEDGSAGEHDHG